MSYAILKWKKPNIHFFGSLRLLPGVNEIDKQTLDALVAHPMTKAYEKDDLLEIIVNSEGQSGIDSLSNVAAIKLIKESFDVELLNGWLDSESRKSVVKAIENQIELLKIKADEPAPKPKPTEQDEEHFS